MTECVSDPLPELGGLYQAEPGERLFPDVVHHSTAALDILDLRDNLLQRAEDALLKLTVLQRRHCLGEQGFHPRPLLRTQVRLRRSRRYAHYTDDAPSPCPPLKREGWERSMQWDQPVTVPDE